MTPGKGRQGKTAVATIAHDNTIYLLQIARLHGNELPRALTNFLLEPHIIKVGSRVKTDLQRLQKESGSEREFSGFIELAQMAKACQASQNARVGLAELSALVLKQQLPKDKAICISDQWDNEVLSEDQVSYAVRDAYASLQIYKRLKVLTELGSVPENAPSGFLVDIYQNDCQKLIATGAWVSVVSDSTSMCTVEVKKIHVPAAIIEHHKCAL